VTLVFNPAGSSLPPPQAALEDAYRRQLSARYGIVFSRLYTITNMPIGRFLDDLVGFFHPNVGRLDVAMNQAGFVGGYQGVGDLHTHLHHTVWGRLVFPEPSVERFSPQELHGQERIGALLAQLENRNDVIVTKSGHGSRLAQETLGRPLRVSYVGLDQVWAHHFEGHWRAYATIRQLHSLHPLL
jgi:hypothetical protein